MSIPKHLQIIIADALFAMRHDKHYHLDEQHRHDIYRTLQPTVEFEGNPFLRVLETKRLDISFEHLTYGYLAIITADHVLPLWEHYAADVIGSDSSTLFLPREMLAAAERILLGTVPLEMVISDYCGIFHEFEDNWYDIDLATYWAGDAAHAALGMILGEPPIEIRGLTALKDVAIAAELACSSIDLTYPSNRVRNEPFFHVDLEKRRDFWEWWLTEAIPTAWEMAESSSSPT